MIRCHQLTCKKQNWRYSNRFNRTFSHVNSAVYVRVLSSVLVHCSSLIAVIDGNGLIHVGCRLSKAKMSSSITNPVVLPKSSHVTQLLVGHCHEKVKHQGRGYDFE